MPESSRLVIWSSQARTDLSEIWNYYYQVAGQLTADKVVRRIVETSRLLEDHPFGGRSRDEIRLGLRSLVARPHVVFYRVVQDRAEIVRVLDGRRDLDEIFASGDRRE
jgi:toxin ParE1/3/4